MNRTLGSLLMAGATLFPSLALAAKADYRDSSELEAAIDLLDGIAGGLVQVFQIGATPAGHQLRAVLISEVRPSGQDAGGNADRPALLIECGAHAREWAAPESCVGFIENFVGAYLTEDPFLPNSLHDVLEDVDLWIIPLVNPDGRDLDDSAGGDPEQFWTSTAWHPDTTSDASGWRANGQLITCATMPFGLGLGIDLNRAYSQGWTDGETNCRHNQYHGAYPFQALEAQHLRKFVENRMISMSLTVHSYGPCVGAQNGDAQVPQNFRSIFNASVPSTASELMLDYAAGTCEGKGVGQFTGWMAKSSDVPGAADFGTHRAAVSLLLELPPDGTAYNDVVTPSPYRFDPADDSNPFHPSDSSFIVDTLRGFIPAVTYLARQARVPWCAIDPVTLQMDSSCVRDFGLTGAKIATCRNCVGLMNNAVVGSAVLETMTAGLRRVVYRVQNFDAVTAVAQTVRITTVISSRVPGPNPYTTDLFEEREYALGAGEGTSDSVPFTFVAGREYMVGLHTVPVSYAGDTNADNNKQLFRFQVN